MDSSGVNIVKIKFLAVFTLTTLKTVTINCPSTDNAVLVCVFKSAVTRDFEMGLEKCDYANANRSPLRYFKTAVP